MRNNAEFSPNRWDTESCNTFWWLLLRISSILNQLKAFFRILVDLSKISSHYFAFGHMGVLSPGVGGVKNTPTQEKTGSAGGSLAPPAISPPFYSNLTPAPLMLLAIFLEKKCNNGMYGLDNPPQKQKK